MRFGPVWPLQTPTPTPTETATEVTTEVATDIGGLLPFEIPMWVVNIGESLVVIGLAIVVSRVLVRLLGRRVAQQFRRPSLTRTVLRGIRVSVYIFALLTILNIYGLRLTDIGLSVAIFSAVVGVVLAPILGSYISGVFLLADQPYEIGDMIELADTGQRGFVEDITLRHTKMFTLDNTFLVIPNGEIRQRDVVNYSAEDSRTRLSLDVLVTYESDIAVARTLIEAAAREVDNVISGGPDIRVGAARYPASPTVYINNFADHGVLLTLRYWVTEPYKLLAVRSKVQTNVWQRLEDADVEIAYPHSHLYFDDTSGEMNVSLNNGLDGIDGIDQTRTVTGDSPVPPYQDPDDLADE
ncbi:mechanosensitive ion channel family protein [Haloarcula rubripromontorii]|uniref:Mechanosensitive ion channel n=1 Tax=Haloarcula rubripromontorii TaxID=1705562 RepID=A0A0N0U9B1_9EURY|nr:mechanosensitive ion channel family protein [Haloarcula rubripromontorii]KOX92260.1 mechanosensitive ion channel protein MscS [Haloarcula rubripromontorii]NLV07060.1 mechanosensitive ion channel [Haloarcula rubripromontorii]